MLKKLGECQDGKYEQLPWDHVESAVTEMFVSMAKHTDKKNSSEIWKILIVSFDVSLFILKEMNLISK